MLVVELRCAIERDGLRLGTPEIARWGMTADDMPAHVRAALTQTSIGIPLREGVLVLGTWQAIYLYEHRTHPQQRMVVAHLIGE